MFLRRAVYASEGGKSSIPTEAELKAVADACTWDLLNAINFDIALLFESPM